MDSILEKLREELKSKADEKTRISGERFFKEDVKLYGIKAAEITRTANNFYKLLADRSKKDVFSLCDELWKSGYAEECFVACNWSYKMKKTYTPGDFSIFEKWVSSYVSNWATCDTLCNHTIGTFIEMYPEFLDELKRWAVSSSRWVRRASAVSLIIPAREGKFLNDIFVIADILHADRDDMVQKGYGWMLKSASQAHLQEVFKYIMKKKATMPRTSLRYAIEKMPAELKARAMAK
jgi:3-methyladenine DNA glycosylase AlkD